MNTKLIAKADLIFSRYVRAARQKGGQNACYTCGTVHPVTELECSRLIDGDKYLVRWNEDNARPQCRLCRYSGNPAVMELFEIKLRQELGDDAVDDLFRIAEKPSRVGDDFIHRQINWIQVKFQELVREQYSE